MRRLELNSISLPLHDKLCAPNVDGTCNYPRKVVLDDNLIYDTPALWLSAKNTPTHVTVFRELRNTGMIEFGIVWKMDDVDMTRALEDWIFTSYILYLA